MLAGILALDVNNGLGYKNNILFKNAIDMKHFRVITCEYVNCVVGRKTAESLPSNFPGRYLKVLSKNPLACFGFLPTYENVLSSFDKQIVIGGNEIYKLFKNDIKVWYVTYFKEAAKNVDVYLDKEVLEVISKTQTKEIIYEDDTLQICKCY